MKDLKQHLDFIAILILAVVLGLGHAPRLRNRIVSADWEHSRARTRVLHIDRLVQHIPTR